MRETSLKVYNDIKENGVLSKRRFQVYDCIFNNAPIIAGDCLRILKSSGHSVSYPGVTARFSELERMGVIYDTGERRKNENGNLCAVWDITNKFPEKIEKPVSEKSMLRKEVEKLNDRLNRMAAAMTRVGILDQPELFT